MGYTQTLLADVRRQLAPDDDVLAEARERRDFVRRTAGAFRGVRYSFRSGSLAHGTANCPVHQRDKGLDADCGLVLNRSIHPTLGPDSASRDGPDEIVDELLAHIEPKVQAEYPGAQLTVTKRAIFVQFHSPLPGGEDPTVDLVVGLERREAPGLWIPNTEQHRWDPSHPERHTELLNAEPKDLRVTRARAIRLGKAESKRLGEPALCSFNLEALAWMFVKQGMNEPEALLALWRDGAADLARRLTPDPARVSAPIKVVDPGEAVSRLRYASDQLALAHEHDDDEAFVRRTLQPLWPDFIALSAHSETKARAAASLARGRPLRITTTGALSTTTGWQNTSVRSYGDSGLSR